MYAMLRQLMLRPRPAPYGGAEASPVRSVVRGGSPCADGFVARVGGSPAPTRSLTIERVPMAGRGSDRIWLPQLTEAARAELGLPSALEWEALFHLPHRSAPHGELLRFQDGPQPRVDATLRMLQRLHSDTPRIVEHAPGFLMRNLIGAARAGFTELVAVEPRHSELELIRKWRDSTDCLPTASTLALYEPTDYDDLPAAARDTAVSLWTHPCVPAAIFGSDHAHCGPYLRRHVLPGGDLLVQTDFPEIVQALAAGAFSLARPAWWRPSHTETLEWVAVHTARAPLLASAFSERDVWVIWLRRLAAPTAFHSAS